MLTYNNYDNFDDALKKVKKDANKISFKFSLDKFLETDVSIESLFSDLISSYFSYDHVKKEEIENLIATIIYELVDYFTFIADPEKGFVIDIFDGIKDKYFLVEFNDVSMSKVKFDSFIELLKTISFKSVRDEYISVLESNKKEIYIEKKFCILFLVADYKAKFLAEVDEDNYKANTCKFLIKI